MSTVASLLDMSWLISVDDNDMVSVMYTGVCIWFIFFHYTADSSLCTTLQIVSCLADDGGVVAYFTFTISFNLSRIAVIQ